MRLGIAIVMVVLLVAICRPQPVQLSVTPTLQTIDVDSIAKVKVRIQTPVSVRAYRVEVSYNPLLLRCVYADKSTFFPLGGSLLFITIDSVNGKVSIDEAMFGQMGRSGEGDLAEIRFRGLRDGTGSLPLPFALVRDTLNQSIANTTSGATVRVGTGTSVKGRFDDSSYELRLLNYPNPFNSSTTISFSLKQNSSSRLLIYNLLGQLVRDLSNPAVENQRGQVVWDGRDDDGRVSASGVYVVRLVTEDKSINRTIQLIK